MNDYEIRQLIFALEKKYDQQIEALKAEIESLKEKKQQPVALIDYYLEKYNKVAKEIKEQRIAPIKKEIVELQQDYDNLQAQTENFQIMTEKYSDNQSMIIMCKEELERVYLKLENYNFEYDRKCNDLYKEIEVLDEQYNERVLKYVGVMDSYNNGEIFASELQLKISQLLRYFKEDGYYNASKTIDYIFDLTKLNNEHQKNMTECNDKIVSLQEEIASLEMDDPNSSLQDLLTMTEDIKNELDRKIKVEASLDELLTNLIQNHQEKIKDVIEHKQLIEASKAEIAMEIDPLVVELLTALETTDTPANVKNNLLLKLSNLNNQLGELEDSVVRRSILEKEYEALQQVLDQVNENLKAMEAYVEKSYQIIRSNQSYRYYFDEYVACNAKMKELTKIINNAKAENEVLKNERKKLIIDPYAKNRIMEIDEKISNNDLKITTSLHDINFIRDDLKESSQINERLFKVIHDKEIAEEKLPIIVRKKEELIKELTMRYEELKSYDHKVEEYNQLIEEAEIINEKLKGNKN